MFRTTFSVMVLSLLFVSMLQEVSAGVKTVPCSDGSTDFIFDGGPADEGADRTICPGNSTAHCKTVNIRLGIIAGGVIPIGSKVSLFVHDNPLDPAIGVGYINVTVDEDYDIESGGDFFFSKDVTQQVHTNLADWEAALATYNAAN